MNNLNSLGFGVNTAEVVIGGIKINTLNHPDSLIAAIEVSDRLGIPIAEMVLSSLTAMEMAKICDKDKFVFGDITKIVVSNKHLLSKWIFDFEIALKVMEAFFDRNNRHEFALHAKFKKNIDKLIAGAELSPSKMKIKDRPDFLVVVDGETRPVEIKKSKFNIKAKLQLQRYMSSYGASIGYAVAPSLNVDLGSNMVFVKLGFDEEHRLSEAG